MSAAVFGQQQIINLGANPNDRTGDTLRQGGQKINANFTQLFNGTWAFFPSTPAEIAAGVTPKAFSYPPGNLLRYGADPTGIADMAVAFNAAVSSNSHVNIPAGKYLHNGSSGSINVTNAEIECDGAPAQYNQPPAYGSAGVTLQFTSTSVNPFLLAGGVRFLGCNYFWPNQNGVNPTPTAYPPLFTEQAGKQLNSFECISCRVINAYDFMDQGSVSNSDAFGDLKFVDLMGYAIRYWFQLANVPEFWSITNFHGDPGIYQGVSQAGPNYYLANWTAANGAFLHVFGNGNGSTVGSSVVVAGLHCNGCDLFAYNKAFWVDSTGAFAESKISGIWDSIPHVVQVDSGGCAADVEIDGPIYSYQSVFPSPGPGGADNATAFSFGTPPTSVCFTTNIRITGHLFAANGDVMDITGANNKSFYVSLGGNGAYGQSSTPGTYYFAQVNGSNAIVDFQGNHVEPKTAGSTRLGFNLVQCYTCTLTGNSFNGVYNSIIIGSGMYNTFQVAATGNISFATPTGGFPIVGTGDNAHQLLLGNSWDKFQQPTFGACGTSPSFPDARSSDVSGLITVGTGAVTSCAVTFANTWTTSIPRCYFNGVPIADQPATLVANASGFTITSTASMAGATISYHCDRGW